jgi:hypothetical protein
MTTTELFKKHFPKSGGAVGLQHPNIEAFFNELNEECLKEDAEKENPYLLSGEELERTEALRKSGR